MVNSFGILYVKQQNLIKILASNSLFVYLKTRNSTIKTTRPNPLGIYVRSKQMAATIRKYVVVYKKTDWKKQFLKIWRNIIKWPLILKLKAWNIRK